MVLIALLVISLILWASAWSNSLFSLVSCSACSFSGWFSRSFSYSRSRSLSFSQLFDHYSDPPSLIVFSPSRRFYQHNSLLEPPF
ncbi:hypothetical protein B9Z19DRAFT_1086556 [Tuber borchii]|uniref:Secreted protein n=1 Tax=Tuber borchii TaxID=42251 RepID=A0A2T6ZP87_TUBBO|nr:hypothetical protein B9Z19DRAFT_1086556 [Tuber borchii]